MTRPIFFCHIPKTAGTTLRKALEAAFPQEEIIPNDAEIFANGKTYPSSAALVTLLSERGDRARLVRGHYHFSLSRLLSDPISIVVLREPVERCISQLKHMISIAGYDMQRAFDALDNGRFPAPDNHMTRYLRGTLDVSDHGKVNERFIHLMREPLVEKEQALSQARSVLKQADIVGVTSRMDLLTEPLERLGVAFDPQKTINKARPMPDFDLTSRQIDTIRRHNEIDAELYAFACDMIGVSSTMQAELSKVPIRQG